MNADHSSQLLLLDLQSADTQLAQLAHRRRTLPELAQLAECQVQLTSVRNEVVDAQTTSSDIAAEQRQMENDVDAVRTRSSRNEERLAGGGVPAKELEGLQHELTSLARRQGALEDDLLEIMVRAEESEAIVAERSARSAELTREAAELTAARDQEFADIDRLVALCTQERAVISGKLPSDLLSLYEKARQHSGGVGAAMLRRRRCEGCHMELAGSEVAALAAAAADEVLRCENCRCILVRTEESGF